MTAFLSRAWRQQPQYPVDPNPEWRVAFNAATSPQSTDSTGVHWRLQGTTNDWLARARVALPPHGIAFQAEQFYGGDDSISGVHSGGAGYLFPREQGTMVVLGRVVTPFAFQPAIAVSNGALLRGDIDETWFQLGGNIWTTGQAWSVAMDGLSALALTWGDFGRRLYKNGRLLASTSTAPSSTAHSGTLNVGGDGMRYWMCAISGDVLDAGSLSENPWQVFRPRTARIYSFPSAGGSIESGAGSSAGTSTAAAVGASTAAGAGSAAGAGTATGVGASTAEAVGTAAGTATASAVGDVAGGVQSGAGSSAGTSTASGVGASTAAATGTSAGTSTAAAVGSSSGGVQEGVGTAAGQATAAGVGASTAEAVGTAAGSSTASAVGKDAASQIEAASLAGLRVHAAREAQFFFSTRRPARRTSRPNWPALRAA